MYEENKKYTKKLTQRKILGNSYNRIIEFKDEEGNTLTWVTNDYTKCAQEMKRTAEYSFIIKYIWKDQIFIKNVRIKKGYRIGLYNI